MMKKYIIPATVTLFVSWCAYLIIFLNPSNAVTHKVSGHVTCFNGGLTVVDEKFTETESLGHGFRKYLTAGGITKSIRGDCVVVYDRED